MKTITSRDNTLIKETCKLGQHKFRSQTGRYLVEGRNLVEEALRAGQPVESILVDVERADQFDDIIAQHAELEWLAITPALMKDVCHTRQPQGIAAVLRQLSRQVEDVMLPGGLLVILDRLSDPGNVGTIIRTAWGFGADGILLTPGCVDVHNPKVVRSTMGGMFTVPVLENVSYQQIKALKQYGYQMLGASGAAARTVYDAEFSGPVAVVIGSEANGIGEELLSLCDHLVRIPMRPGVDSLNAAVAAGIILNQAFRTRNSGPLFV